MGIWFAQIWPSFHLYVRPAVCPPVQLDARLRACAYASAQHGAFGFWSAFWSLTYRSYHWPKSIKNNNNKKFEDWKLYLIEPTAFICNLRQLSFFKDTSCWPGLGLQMPKAVVVIPKIQPLPKHLRINTSKNAKHACHYATRRPVKMTMYLGLDIIIKIKITTVFDRCAILKELKYLTKNFESWWVYS